MRVYGLVRYGYVNSGYAADRLRVFVEKIRSAKNWNSTPPKSIISNRNNEMEQNRMNR